MNRSLRADFVETFGVEFLVLAAGLYLFRLASMELGTDGFSEFVLARRVISLLQPVVVVGADVALVRFVAMALGNRPEIGRHVTTAALTMAGAVTVVVGLLAVSPGASARFLLGSASSSPLVLPLAGVMAGAALLPLCYSYLRGTGLFRHANLLQVLAVGGTPIAAVALSGGSAAQAVAGIAVGWTVIPAAFLLALRPPAAAPTPRNASRPLLRYAWRRFPGDLLLMGLLSLPPLVATHVAGMTEAAIFAVGVSMVTLVGSLFAPVGQVVLPAASRWVGEGRRDRIRRYAVGLLLGAAGVSALAVACVVVASEWILTGYLALALDDVGHAGRILRTAVLAGIPFGVYMGVRRILDAIHDGPVNARNLTWAFLAFAVLTAGAVGAGLGIVGMAWAFVGAVSVLGLLTLRSLWLAVAEDA